MDENKKEIVEPYRIQIPGKSKVPILQPDFHLRGRMSWTALDANILVFAEHKECANHIKAAEIVEEAIHTKGRFCVTPQVLAEYYATITSRKKFERPLTSQEARERIGFLLRSRNMKKVFPKRWTVKRCVELCARHDVKGVKIFDMFFAATLLDNGVQMLFTHNVKDFNFLRDLRVENPF